MPPSVMRRTPCHVCRSPAGGKRRAVLPEAALSEAICELCLASRQRVFEGNLLFHGGQGGATHGLAGAPEKLM